jgi:radical SAM protein with 4Fe4S-binding SPASM domain
MPTRRQVRMDDRVDLSVVVVSCNTEGYLRDCLRSIHDFPARSASCEVVVIDNASEDGSTSMVRREFPHVSLLCNRRNVGYARAVNQGLRLARGRLLMVMNSDTRVLDGSLQRVVDYMDQHPSVGGMSPMLLKEDGSPQTSWARFPTMRDHVLSLLPIRHALPRSWWGGEPAGVPSQAETQPRDIDSPAGACFVTRRIVLSTVGLMDPDYFMYFEDLDWAYRMMEAGWRRTFYPGARLIHAMGVSWPAGSETEKLARSFEGKYIYLSKRSGRPAARVARWTTLISSGLSFSVWGALRVVAPWWGVPRGRVYRAGCVLRAHGRKGPSPNGREVVTGFRGTFGVGLGQLVNHARGSWAVRRRPARVRSSPRFLQVEVSSRCNLACTHCLRPRVSSNLRTGDMDLETFRRVANELPRLDVLTVHGLGEPLLNRDLPHMVRYYRALNPFTRIGMSTNGLLLENGLLTDVLECGFYEIGFSLDAATSETYRAVRGSGGFERVLGNIEALLQRRVAHRPRVVVALVVMKENYREMARLVRVARELGVDQVSLCDLNLLWADQVNWTDEEVAQVRHEWERARRAAATAGIELTYAQFDKTLWATGTARRPCFYLWDMPYVTWDGSVTPCCALPDPDLVQLGSLRERGFKELWNAPAYRAYREAVTSREPPSSCRGCHHLC